MNEADYPDAARKYLLTFDGVTDAMIEMHLNEWRNKMPNHMPSLFQWFVTHAQNRRGMPGSIGDISKLKPFLFNFHPREVLNNYSRWQDLFDTIRTSSYTPPGRMVKGNNKNYWVIYCKSILSIAEFLSRYRNIREFDDFVKGFYTNEYSRAALPLLLKQELFGFGFALACDVLKEIGYTDFVKADTHIKYISLHLGITNSVNDYEVFKDVIAYCQRIGKTPYEVDKLFWLVGSGRFYLNKVIIKTSRDDFIALVNA